MGKGILKHFLTINLVLYSPLDKALILLIPKTARWLWLLAPRSSLSPQKRVNNCKVYSTCSVTIQVQDDVVFLVL